MAKKTYYDLSELEKGLIRKYWSIGWTYQNIADKFEIEKIIVLEVLKEKNL